MKNPTQIIFVGQGPSQDGDPYRPLEGTAAARLGSLLDAPEDYFIGCFARINLNSEWIGKVAGDGKGDVFDLAEGRASAKVLIRGSWTHYVLLGKRVAERFDAKGEFLQTISHGQKHFLILPHPSGINRWWNEPNNVAAAAEKLKGFLK
jgi:uracil-DNA glycosylase